MTNVFDGEQLHVMSARCATCIFRPGNLMQLVEGRVEQMEAEALANNGAIPCHETTYGQRRQEAVCRGFFDRAKAAGHPLMQMAERLDVVVFDDMG